ncbi:28S ribosomal protein S6, mitochondrial [Anabarilius grahami]|uniref:Small ribosomal subunit protein bS6m n=1 Tax=Anabarilius grahami TaxID=495550 RepID=A0A3N0XCQ0_ANAGA|nr:28S ribosomal protein S6, mitochondrial [Anabarilius grahami]
MPRYELCVILKAMQRLETAAVLRRTVETLFERGAVVRSLENLGERRLPYKISKHNCLHTHGGYFSIDFHASTNIVSELLDHLERDVDVLRPTVLKKDVEVSEAQGCGLQNEKAKVIRVKRFTNKRKRSGTRFCPFGK